MPNIEHCKWTVNHNLISVKRNQIAVEVVAEFAGFRGSCSVEADNPDMAAWREWTLFLAQQGPKPDSDKPHGIATAMVEALNMLRSEADDARRRLRIFDAAGMTDRDYKRNPDKKNNPRKDGVDHGHISPY